MTKYIVLVALLFSAIIVIVFYQWDSNDLGSGYYYMPEYKSIDVGYSNGGIIYRSSRENLIKKVIIEENVIAAKSNKTYIVAIQTNVYKKKEDVSKYYIIDKRNDSVYGPMLKTEFQNLKKELNISIELKIPKAS